MWNAGPVQISRNFGIALNRNMGLACVMYSWLLNRLWLSEANKFYVTSIDVTLLITTGLKVQFFFLMV